MEVYDFFFVIFIWLKEYIFFYLVRLLVVFFELVFFKIFLIQIIVVCFLIYCYFDFWQGEGSFVWFEVVFVVVEVVSVLERLSYDFFGNDLYKYNFKMC